MPNKRYRTRSTAREASGFGKAMVSKPVTLSFSIGSRRLFAIERHLADIAYSLDDLTSGQRPHALGGPGADGLRVLSAPPCDIPFWQAQFPRHRIGAVQHYRRHFIAMQHGFDDYMANFSGKTRSTLRRKRRRFEKADGGGLDLRCYRSEREIAEFLALATPLARKTYQARLLDAALPDDAESQREILGAAARDAVRAFLLFLKGEPVAYLYLPVDGTTLIYAFLGYDPAHAELSPGTVLQMGALEHLFAERRFTHFDFTEGDGAHKALFGTDSLPCCTFVLLTPQWRNITALASHAAFESAVEVGKRILSGSRAEEFVRRALGR